MKLNKSQVIFDKQNHLYKIGSINLRGITGIISKYIFPNKYEGIPFATLKKAADRGSAIHEDIERYELDCYINGESLSNWIDYLPSTRSYAELMQGHSIKHLESEYIVSDNYRFASAIDKVDQDFNIYDIKTTYSLDKDYLSWQLSIYAYLFELQNKFAVKNLFAIWIKDNNASLIEIEKIDSKIIEEFLEAAFNGNYWSNPLEKNLVIANDILQKALEFESLIKKIEEEKNNLELNYNLIKKKIEEEMTAQNIKSWETESIKITRVLSSTSKIFDSKKFKEEQPELAAQYEKETEKKSYLKITLK